MQLDLRREPENVESAGQCVSRRVRHLIDSCIAHRERIAELEAKLGVATAAAGEGVALRVLGEVER